MRVVLTSDGHTYRYLPALPRRLLPPFVRGSKHPPYGLRKVQARTGWEVLPPEEAVRLALRGQVDAVGVYVNDPKGLTPVSRSLKSLFRELGQEESFKELVEGLRKAKELSGVKVFAGGPGAWQVEGEPWLDLVVYGEAESLSEEVLSERGKVQLPRAEKFLAIRGPSGMAEVEVMRGDREVDFAVVEEEMRLQAKAHGYVNLISHDLFAHPRLYDLLALSRKFGRVKFSNVTVKSATEVDLGRVREVLGLSESNFVTPVLSDSKGSCTLEEFDVIKDLNEAFIYPTVFVRESRLEEVAKYKVVAFPIVEDNPARAFYLAWKVSSEAVRRPYAGLVERVLKKNFDNKGRLLRESGLLGVALSILIP
ncbi:MAG: hypothetical protein ACP5HQ_07705 [Thermoprotei archaeon]